MFRFFLVSSWFPEAIVEVLQEIWPWPAFRFSHTCWVLFSSEVCLWASSSSSCCLLWAPGNQRSDLSAPLYNMCVCATTVSKIHSKCDTFLLLRSTGWRHFGELLRVLFTSEDTGWKVKMSLDWSSFKASRDFTSPKSSHFLTSSSPSKIAGILKTTT